MKKFSVEKPKPPLGVKTGRDEGGSGSGFCVDPASASLTLRLYSVAVHGRVELVNVPAFILQLDKPVKQ